MAKLDLTKTNQAIERLLEVTENPRHRFMLQAYYRRRARHGQAVQLAARSDGPVQRDAPHVLASGERAERRLEPTRGDAEPVT